MKLTQKLGIAYLQTKIKLTAAVSKRKAAEKAFELFCTPLERSKRTKVPEYAEPLQFSFNNLKINGHRWNHPPTAPPERTKKALILHGFSSAAHKFDSYATMLASKGYEVLSFDAPAHGSSEGRITNGAEYSEMVIKVNELYGPFDTFIAHSVGGLAISLALEKIPHTAQTKLVLIAPATETTSIISAAFNLLRIKDKVVQNEFNNLVYEKSGHDASWFSVRRAVKNISAQILWLHDENDYVTIIEDALKVKADNHTNINFIITQHLGHRKIYHDVQVKKAIENFV
jgi:pimeloyl-ACP methyl ester carboxylesterase